LGGYKEEVVNGQRILIVDDHGDTAEILAHFVERAGGTATAVSDGSTALSVLRSDPHDAVVLDCQLPGMSGLELLRIMRDDERLRDLPVMMYSADATPDKRRMAHDLGVHDYVVKGDMLWSSVITKIAQMTGPLQ
jgi:two-component system chemotaxis response regulator CheY